MNLECYKKWELNIKIIVNGFKGNLKNCMKLKEFSLIAFSFIT